MCDWCRLEKQRAVKKEKRVTLDIKETTRGFSQCTLKSPDSGLEFLIKAALSSEQVLPPLESAAAEAGNPSPTADCGSNCSSSLESEKLSCGMGSLSCGPGDASSNSCENRMAIDTSISDEEGSHGTLQVLPIILLIIALARNTANVLKLLLIVTTMPALIALIASL